MILSADVAVRAAFVLGLVLLAPTRGPAALLSRDPEVVRAAEDRGRRFVEAVNSDDTSFRAVALRETFVPESLAGDGEAKVLGLVDRLRGELGTLEFHHAEAMAFGDGDGKRASLHVYVKSTKDGGWYDLQFFLDPAPPHRIRQLVFRASVTEPVYLPNGDIRSATTLAWLDEYVERLASHDGLSGTLLLAHGDDVFFERYFGSADAAGTLPVTADTRFNAASGGKMFTAVLVAQLLEQGKLRTGDTLDRVLPAVAKEPFAKRVTIAHLLTHTSGIAEYWNADYEARRPDLRDLADFLPFVLKVGTTSAPGERFEYSNSNYILLGLVLEAVTGEPYDRLLSERILVPAGMHDSGLIPLDDRDPSQAQELMREGKGWKVAPHGYRGSSAGGALSTPRDMLRFARALVGGRLVSRETLAGMTTSKTGGLAEAMQYGYGFILEPAANGAVSFGHGGIARGVNFELRCFPDLDITLVAFSNQDNGAYDDLRRNTIRLVTGDR